MGVRRGMKVRDASGRWLSPDVLAPVVSGLQRLPFGFLRCRMWDRVCGKEFYFHMFWPLSICIFRISETSIRMMNITFFPLDKLSIYVSFWRYLTCLNVDKTYLYTERERHWTSKCSWKVHIKLYSFFFCLKYKRNISFITNNRVKCFLLADDKQIVFIWKLGFQRIKYL